jgi:hypothetical protein
MYTPLNYLHAARLSSLKIKSLPSIPYEILQIFKHIKGVAATKTNSITEAVSQQQHV